jgi:glycosyltransferase involved in cell wall biosynthesis
MPRRVLLIAYYLPPAGGPAVQRNLQFVAPLQKTGWQPEILTVREGAFPNRDASLLDAIPGDVPVHRTAAFDPLALYARLTGGDGMPAGALGDDEGSWLEALARWIRANLFIPDARIGWWPFAVRRAQSLLATGRFDALLTTGAPHSVHLIGRTLHRSTGVPWVADLHDPWTDISYYDELPHTAAARRLDAHFERSVLQEASAVTTVSPSWAALFASKAANRYAVVENGVDLQEFDGLHPPLADDFVVAHVGKLYASRNPTAVWDAIAQLRSEGALPRLRIRCVGTLDPAVEHAVQQRGLADRVERVGFVPHHEALRIMAASPLLLLVIEPFAQAEGMITSKLYEYLASERPVLGVGPPGGDADALLRQHDAGEVVGWNDAERAYMLLQQHYNAWTRGTPRRGASRADLHEHARPQQAERMAEVLNTVTRLSQSST